MLLNYQDDCFPVDRGRVEMPKGKYNGHTLTRDVSTKMPATIPSTIAQVPFTIPAKIKSTSTAARMILIMLSNDPMFFSINIVFYVMMI